LWRKLFKYTKKFFFIPEQAKLHKEMKLRCTSNSIRLRVRKSDLDLLQQSGEVQSFLHFAPGVQFSYALKIGAITQPVAVFENHQICITLPQDIAQNWIESNQVSLEYQQASADGQFLHLLIEKDFPCRHTEEGDLKDTFFELAPKDDAAC